jgi:hypothetical protein
MITKFSEILTQKFGHLPKEIAKISENAFLDRSPLIMFDPPIDKIFINPFP